MLTETNKTHKTMLAERDSITFSYKQRSSKELIAEAIEVAKACGNDAIVQALQCTHRLHTFTVVANEFLLPALSNARRLFKNPHDIIYVKLENRLTNETKRIVARMDAYAALVLAVAGAVGPSLKDEVGRQYYRLSDADFIFELKKLRKLTIFDNVCIL